MADKRIYSAERLAEIFRIVATEGPYPERLAKRCRMTIGQVQGIHRRHRVQWDEAARRFFKLSSSAPVPGTFGPSKRPMDEGAPLPKATPARLIDRQEGDERVVTSVSPTIKTVDDLVRHLAVDLEKFEIAASEGTKWAVAARVVDADGVERMETTDLHRVWVRFRPKRGPSVDSLIETMIAASFTGRQQAPAIVTRRSESDILQVLEIADPHLAKYAWGRATGWGDYDLNIACDVLRESTLELMARGDRRLDIGHRDFWLLGDFFHYDNPQGMTTKGTPQDRDGRVQKMIDRGTEVLCGLIEASARVTPTNVIVVPGNHDMVLSVALQRILRAQFRNDSRVTIDTQDTARKYREYGANLFGLHHGDKGKKRLPALMTKERRAAWGRSSYQEIHTGHLHSLTAIETIEGTIVRTAPALCPPDDWHAEEGYAGNLRAMETFYYHGKGGLIGMDLCSPDFAYRAQSGRLAG